MLSPAQFAERFAPSQAVVAAVESWATAHGLQVNSVSPDRLLLRLSGSTSALGSALGTSFHRFRAVDGSSYVSSTAGANLPASLAGAVSAIGGLSDLARVQLDTVHRSSAATPGLSFPASYGPQELSSLYGASAAQTGAGQTVSVIAEGDLSQPKADLAQFESTLACPPSPGTRSTSARPPATPKAMTSGTWTRSTRQASRRASNRLNLYVGSSLENDRHPGHGRPLGDRRREHAGQLLGRRVRAAGQHRRLQPTLWTRCSQQADCAGPDAVHLQW